MPDTPRPHRGPSPRRLFAVAVAAAVACFVLTLSYGYADHAPAPHGVRVAVAAPAGFAAGLPAGLAHAAPGSDLSHPLLVLGIWLAASLAVLACVDLLHLAERRRAPEQQADIYATSGTAHLRRRLARQRAAALETVTE